MIKLNNTVSRQQFLCLLLFLFLSLTVHAQKIKNVRFETEGKMINVFYDITGAKTGQSFLVSLYVSEDNGITWGFPLVSVTGNVGANQSGGVGKKIVWDVLADLPRLTGNILFDVRATVTGGYKFSIGQSYGGGIIFYIDSTTQHGLIAATIDQSRVAYWGCHGSLIDGTSTAIGKGQANTTAIVNGCHEPGIAARICNDLVLNEYEDWFLPSLGELELMNQLKNIIGGFENGRDYWSSSDDNIYYAKTVVFYMGGLETIGHNDKSGLHNVRAVRAF